MDRILQPSEYSFNAAAKTVAITLSSGGTVRLENLKLIINQTDNIIIFSSTNTSKQATLAGSTFTLEYDTTSMSNGDALKIIYYDQDYVNPVSVSGVSTSAKQDTIIGHIDGLEAAFTTLNAKDFATQTTLAALLAKVIAAPSTEAKQDTIIGHIDGLETAFTTLNAKDFATQTTLAAILAKIIAAPATEAKQDTIIGHVDGIETALTTLNAKDFATQTTLAAILAKIIAAPATEAKQDTMITALQTIDNFISGSRGLVTEDNSASILTATQAIQTAVQLIDNAVSGNELQVDIVGALPAGTNNIGDVDVLSIAAGSNLIGDVGIKPRTSGGLTIFRSIDVDETEEDIKTSAGQMYGYYLFNTTAATIYVKFYNATAANVTVGTTTPILTIPVPAGSGANVFSEIGVAFSTALSIAATTGVADSDTGAPAANALIANIYYN